MVYATYSDSYAAVIKSYYRISCGFKPPGGDLTGFYWMSLAIDLGIFVAIAVAGLKMELRSIIAAKTDKSEPRPVQLHLFTLLVLSLFAGLLFFVNFSERVPISEALAGKLTQTGEGQIAFGIYGWPIGIPALITKQGYKAELSSLTPIFLNIASGLILLALAAYVVEKVVEKALKIKDWLGAWALE